MDTRITTGKVRLSYANLFMAKAASPGAEPKYSVSVLVDKSDKATLKKIQDAIEAAKAEGKSSKWNGRIPANLKQPLRDGDADKPDAPEYAGKMFFNCSSTRRPGVVDANIQPILDPDEVYSGCYGRVNVNFYPYNFNGTMGIAAGLNHVQKLEDGERFGGGISAEAAFGDDDGLFD